jgi:hypothetical protein
LTIVLSQPAVFVNYIISFPKTFLGVLLSDETFRKGGTPRGGARSDWLFDAAIERLVAHLGWTGSSIEHRIESELNHDIRAALVCVLTAGFANAGTATVVGDRLGGWFWLPPTELWADWAAVALETTMADARRRGYPGVLQESGTVEAA